MNTPGNSKRNYRFGLFEADSANGELLRQGVRVRLQDLPFRLLIILLERAGEVVSREDLRQKLWAADTYVEFDGSLNAALKRLRGALGDSAENPIFIETLPKRGYRFIAPVAVQGIAPEAPPGVLPVESPAAVSAVTSAPPRPRPSTPRQRSIVIYVAGIIALITGLGWYALHGRSTANSKPATAVPVVAVRKSVAVLGFHNASGRSDDQWLATALSEMLSTELTSGEKLRMVPGEEVSNLRVSSPWPQTGTLGPETSSRIGTALNSDVLVYGAFTDIGAAGHGQLRLDVRLQDARTGEVLTQVAQSSSSNDLFRVTTEIGAKLRDRLGVPGISDADQASVLASLPLNREAARFYGLGIEKLREFDALAAKDLLEQATKADPKFSLGHAMLARAWNQLGYEQKRKEEAKKALDLAVDLPQVDRMQVEGDYYASLPDYEKATSTYRALFALFPDNIEYGLQLADAQRAASYGKQSLETLTQLRRLPPPGSLDPRIDIAEASIASAPAESLVLLESALSKASTQGKKLVYARARIQQCKAYIYGEHPEKSQAPCEDAYNIYRAAGNDLGAADALRLMGDRQGAEGHLQEARADYQKALRMLAGTGEHHKTAAILNNMAIAYANAGNLAQGEQLYRRAKLNFELSGDKVNAGLALANIADIDYFRGNLPAAARTYQQAYEVMASVENADVRYPLIRLADTNLVQGNVKDAHRFAAQAAELSMARHADADESMSELGDVLMAEGDLPGARQQYQAALDIRQARGKAVIAAESRLSLADVALEENHFAEAEMLVRAAIAEYEKEQSDPATASAYTELSRVLLAQEKLAEADKAARRATELSRATPDPTLKLSLSIQSVRVEIAEWAENARGRAATRAATRQLQTVIASAKKLRYYAIECEARLTLAEAQRKSNPAIARSQLEILARETHDRGMDLLARKAHSRAALPQSALSAN